MLSPQERQRITKNSQYLLPSICLLISIKVLHKKIIFSYSCCHVMTHNVTKHCVKSVQIRSYFWSVFSRNPIEYFVSLQIQSECGKIRTRNNSVFGHFSRSEGLLEFCCIRPLPEKQSFTISFKYLSFQESFLISRQWSITIFIFNFEAYLTESNIYDGAFKK